MIWAQQPGQGYPHPSSPDVHGLWVNGQRHQRGLQVLRLESEKERKVCKERGVVAFAAGDLKDIVESSGH